MADPLRAVAWAAVDAWLLHSEDLDEAMDDLRDFLKGKPDAIAKAEALGKGA